MVLDEIHTRAVIEHPMLNLQCSLRKAATDKQHNNDELFQHDGVLNEGVLNDVGPAPQRRAQAVPLAVVASRSQRLADHR